MCQPVISVIIPVYNAEKYISYCVDSVLKQSYKELELILVDDGSTDSSPELCDNYAERDNRVHVVHKRNGGVSQARNVGIEHATGEYIMFVDNDDILSHNALKTYASMVTKYGVDIIQGKIVSETIGLRLKK